MRAGLDSPLLQKSCLHIWHPEILFDSYHTALPHSKKKKEGAIEFCGQVKALGYKVFAQAVSITSYNDEELMDLIRLVNALAWNLLI